MFTVVSNAIKNENTFLLSFSEKPKIQYLSNRISMLCGYRAELFSNIFKTLKNVSIPLSFGRRRFIHFFKNLINFLNKNLFVKRKMKCFKNFISSLVFRYIYQKYRGKFFPIFSQSPKYLNFAFPDDSILYYIYSTNKPLTLVGIVPKDKTHFWSISVYDTKGIVTQHVDDSEVGDNYEIRFKIESSSCVIIRFYLKKQFHQKSMLSYLPTLTPRVPKILQKDRQKNSKNLSNLLLRQSSVFRKKSKFNFSQFFFPSIQKEQNLFPNANAKYCIAHPPETFTYIKVTGNLPSKIGRPHSLRFISFMLGNLNTTATDASVSFEELPKNYTFWLGFEKDKQKISEMAAPGEPVLVWKNSSSPILVYREVRIKKDFSFTTENNPEATKMEMKSFYPKIEYF